MKSIRRAKRQATDADPANAVLYHPYSHSIVPGGLEVTS